MENIWQASKVYKDVPQGKERYTFYKETYNVGDDFIESDTILVNEDNMRIMLNDPKHPYGHGYCLVSLWLELILVIRLLQQHDLEDFNFQSIFKPFRAHFIFNIM
jgi:hypothetical protein